MKRERNNDVDDAEALFREIEETAGAISRRKHGPRGVVFSKTGKSHFSIRIESAEGADQRRKSVGDTSSEK